MLLQDASHPLLFTVVLFYISIIFLSQTELIYFNLTPYFVHRSQVPNEWDSWLRFTREKPPTLSELHKNANRSRTGSRKADDEEVNSKKVMKFNEDAKRLKEQQAAKHMKEKDGVEKSQNVDSWMP